MKAKVDPKIYVRCDEGAKRYSMCKNTFMKLATEANAVYRIRRVVLINTKIFEEYLELFRLEGQ